MQTAIPELKISLCAPLLQLEQHILDHHVQIETWFRQQWQQHPAPIYGSVDLRNAGFKLAPVDMNLFPGGFNNLDPHGLALAVQAMQDTIKQRYPACRRILLIPENHTRNQNYLENLRCLQDILLCAGYETRIGSLIETIRDKQTIELPSGKTVELEPLKRQQDNVSVDDFHPCLILLNNDLSDGLPEILHGLQQPIYPAVELGWSKRLKSNHFGHYQRIANEFAQLINIDPWLLTPEFRHCGKINFLKREGQECILHHAGVLFSQIERKYQEHNVDAQPFIVIKADTGTYGMAVMMVRSLDELFNLNRKTRTKMSASKGGQPVSQVIVQEGVYSFERWQGNIAEPVVYLIGSKVVGGFYRVHENKGPDDNLNTPGMQFQPLPFCDPCNMPNQMLAPHTSNNRFYIYAVIARLSALASASEKQEALDEADD
ncbi:MAG: glutamate--cysteine ligase [Gammaproteobacteria bacterium]|nr:glutamate--cysteine ligase [Gammaproteobacteria bacterium]